ncbi:Hypothetical predicted protein [Paramuricea clavata]|uniref:Uncharacterized protein n=1 Tax=Paramuricea clavata TaxID=317549 RepID=A0A7D9HD93_PARCT|nr:Hypothetical predicted protein [Paramuricea clavata]
MESISFSFSKEPPDNYYRIYLEVIQIDKYHYEVEKARISALFARENTNTC